MGSETKGRTTLEEKQRRLLAKIVKDVSGCWFLPMARNPKGYVTVQYNGRQRLGHGVVYEITHGPVPVGMVLDHLCRVRHCVNPRHLEVVTNAENIRRGVGAPAVNGRKTHCIHGHPLSGANLLVQQRRTGPIRACRACRAKWSRQVVLRVSEDRRKRRVAG